MRNILLTLIALVLASCGGEMPMAATPASANLTPPEFAWEEESSMEGIDEARTPVSKNVSAPFDIGGVMRQVHFAFREKDGLFEGGDTNYAVKVAKDGSFSVTPYHYPNGREDIERNDRHEPREKMERMESRKREKPMTGKTASFRTVGFPVPKMRINDNAHLEMVRGDVIEELKNTEKGVEQSWRFAKKPEATGDLTISVAVEGLEYIGTTDNGLHFAGKRSKLGIYYSHAQWIAADGKVTTINVEWKNGTIQLVVPEVLLVASSYPSVLDPYIGPEFGVDEPVYGPAESRKEQPDIAYNGLNYLIVWQDYRMDNYDIYGSWVSEKGEALINAGIAISYHNSNEVGPRVACEGENCLVTWSNSGDTYGARISSDGKVLDPDGILISGATNAQYQQSITYGNGSYFVVWRDYRNNNVGDIYGCRITTSGSVLDPSGISISAASGAQAQPAISFDGTNYLVVWSDYRVNASVGQIFGARIDESGLVLDPSGIQIGKGTYSQDSPAIAFDGTNYFVVWKSNKSILGSRVKIDGESLDLNNAILIANYVRSAPDIAFDGMNYFIVWSGDTLPYQIYGAEVSPSGMVVKNNIYVTADDINRDLPVIAFDGSNYFVVWGENNDIRGSRVTTSGLVIDFFGELLVQNSNNQEHPSVAFDGSNFLVVWQDDRSGNYDVWGARLRFDGILLDTEGFPISTASGNQKNPVVGFDGTYFLVVWEDYRSGSSDIYASRVQTIAGDVVVVDIDGIVISGATNNQNEPAIAFDGSDYLVVWQDMRSGVDSDIFGARLGVDGIVIDTDGFIICSKTGNQARPSVSFGNGLFLVAWEDRRKSADCDIYATRIENGSLLDIDGFPVNTSTSIELTPSIAFDGTQFLVVWSRPFPTTPPYYTNYGVYATRIDTNGTILDPTNITISQGVNLADTSVIFDDTAFFVTYENDGDIYAARVEKNGAIDSGTPIPVVETGKNEKLPVVVFDGTNYLIAWQGRMGASNYDLFSTRLTTDLKNNTRLGGNGIGVTTNSQYQPAVAFDGANYFVVWSDFRNYGKSLTDIYGARVDQQGKILDTSGIAISRAAQTQTSPDIAFDGTNYMVVWSDMRAADRWEIYSTLVSKDGAVFTEDGLLIKTLQTANLENPVIGFDGTNYFVLWEQSSVTETTIYGAVLDLDGNIIAGTNYFGSGASPRIAFAGINGLLVYELNGNIYGKLINGSGDPGVSVNISSAQDIQGEPAISSDGLGWMVVWEDNRNGSYDIYGARLTSDGVLSDVGGIAISSADGDQLSPTIIFDGKNFVVAWMDYRNGANSDIYGAKVSREGFVVQPDIVLASSNHDEKFPQSVMGNEGKALMVYQVFDETSEIQSARIRGRFFYGGYEGDYCEEDFHCDEGNPCTQDKCEVNGGAYGTCTHLVGAEGPLCRPSRGVCDAAEYCDGVYGECPLENYTSVNGDLCDDGTPFTKDDVCFDGICAGVPLDGLCNNPIKIDDLPYTNNGSIVDRPSGLTFYGTSCVAEYFESGELVYELGVETEVEYQIRVLPETPFDIAVNLIGSCEEGERCIASTNSGADGFVEVINYTANNNGSLYIVVEGSSYSEAGAFELSVLRIGKSDDDIVSPDNDIEIETDDTIVMSDNDTNEPTDEAIDDTQADNTVVDEDVIDDTVTTDDGTSADTDITVPDSTDTVVTDIDTFQPDETVDEPVDSTVEDADSITPDDQPPLDTDTAKPKDGGCGCSTVF